MAERVFRTLKEVKDAYFPHRDLNDLEGRTPARTPIQDIIEAQRKAKEVVDRQIPKKQG